MDMDMSASILVTAVLLISSLYVTNSMSNHKKAVSLYNANDTILQLDYSNINSTIFGRDTAFLVEFYSSWCGHCIHFAPKWRKLAADTYQWSKVIQMGAINCASEENFPICTSYEIKGFPTVKFFPAFAALGQKGLEVKQTKNHRAKMVEYIEMHLGSQRPKHWPIFRHLDSKTSYDSLPSQFADFRRSDYDDNNNNQPLAVVLVFHRSSSPYQPKYVTLHLSSDPRLQVFGVDVDGFRKADNEAFLGRFSDLRRLDDDDDDDNDDDNDDEDGSTVGYLLLFASRKDEVVAAKSDSSSSFSVTSLADVNMSDAVALQKRLKDLIPWTSVGLTFVPHSPSLLSSKSSDLPPPPPRGVFMSDLLKGIRYALFAEIGLRASINPGDDLDAVNSFVGLLTKYFPGDDATTRFLRQINGWLQTRGNATIGGREWRRRVQNAARGTDAASGESGGSDVADVMDRPWVGCRGTRPTLRGYPCSLWTLFHVLSIAASDANSGVEEDQVNGREVIETMAKYIKRFFGCRECATHFEAMVIEDLDDSVQSYDDVILWLWKAHNKVNERLKGASSEDPQAPKIQFPDVPTCLSCRIEGNQAAWHYLNVKQFLKNYYRNITVVGGGVAKSLGGGVKAGVSRGVISGIKPTRKKSVGIESIEGSEENHRYRPRKLAIIKKMHQEKRKNATKVLGDHVNVEQLRQRERETRRRHRPTPGVLGFTDWDVRICFGAYGLCAAVLVCLYVVYIDRRCRHRWFYVKKRRSSSGGYSKLLFT